MEGNGGGASGVDMDSNTGLAKADDLTESAKRKGGFHTGTVYPFHRTNDWIDRRAQLTFWTRNILGTSTVNTTEGCSCIGADSMRPCTTRAGARSGYSTCIGMASLCEAG